jgi:hypothetical protein
MRKHLQQNQQLILTSEMLTVEDQLGSLWSKIAGVLINKGSSCG